MSRRDLCPVLGVMVVLMLHALWLRPTAHADLVVSITQVSGRQFTDLNGGAPSDGTLSGEFPASALVSKGSAGAVTHRFGFEFPLTVIPMGATVTSATFTAAETFDNGGGSAIYGRAGDGVIDLGDLFDFSNLLGNASSGAGNGTTTGGVSLDVTSIVQGLLAGSQSYLVLSLSPGATNGEYRISNFDGSGSNIDPKLSVSYVTTVPEVSSFLLVGLVTAGVFAARFACRHSTRVAAL